MYRLELSREAVRFFEGCDKAIAKKLARCFGSLEKNPRAGNNVKALKGRFAGSYRYRVGDLRVVHTINDREVVVFVITIARRSDVYQQGALTQSKTRTVSDPAPAESESLSVSPLPFEVTYPWRLQSGNFMGGS